MLLRVKLVADEMGELAALPIHTHRLRVKTAALGHFVARSHMLLEIYLIITVGESASVTKATPIV